MVTGNQTSQLFNSIHLSLPVTNTDTDTDANKIKLVMLKLSHYSRKEHNSFE